MFEGKMEHFVSGVALATVIAGVFGPSWVSAILGLLLMSLLVGGTSRVLLVRYRHRRAATQALAELANPAAPRKDQAATE